MPGVSMMTTGPMGRSSIAFKTGSVVVPRTSETRASSWLVTAFTTLDLPALRMPKNPMWTRSPEGVSFNVLVLRTASLTAITSYVFFLIAPVDDGVVTELLEPEVDACVAFRGVIVHTDLPVVELVLLAHRRR